MTDDRLVNCPICNEKTNSLITRELRRGHGSVYCCNFCEHGFIPIAQSYDPNLYYDEEYRKEYSHRSEGGATNAEEIFNIYSRFQATRMRSIERHIDANTAVLEVGASAGQFISQIKNRVARVAAIELDKDCSKFIEEYHGIECYSSTLDKSPLANQKFDIVCSFQVMEHVPDHLEFLRQLLNVTRPGGKVFIEVPNIDDALLSIWDVPSYRKFYFHAAHLHYFSSRSLRLSAKRLGIAEEQLDLEFHQDYNLLNHLHWLMNGEPQATCEFGLSEINVSMDDSNQISQWLNRELVHLASEYQGKLSSSGKTSNIFLTITKSR